MPCPSAKLAAEHAWVHVVSGVWGDAHAAGDCILSRLNFERDLIPSALVFPKSLVRLVASTAAQVLPDAEPCVMGSRRAPKTGRLWTRAHSHLPWKLRMEAGAHPGARRLCMARLQSHWCPQHQCMQMVSSRLQPCLALLSGRRYGRMRCWIRQWGVQRLSDCVLQVLASCLPMLHGQAIEAQLPGPGMLALAVQARLCIARARRSCHPPCSASPRRSAAAPACMYTATRDTTAPSRAAACPLLVRPQLLTVSGTCASHCLHQHCTASCPEQCCFPV